MNVRIQVLISEPTKYGQFNDALYFSQAEYDALSEADIAAMSKARVDAWVYDVEHPPVHQPPTAEQLTERAVRLQKDLDSIYVAIPILKTARIAELTAVKK